MAAPPTFQPVARALVSTLRTNSSLKDALTGMYEALAPNGAEYPYLTYDLYGSTSKWDFSGAVYKPKFMVQVWSDDQVQARTLDQLVHETLWDVDLGIAEQSTLLCRRTKDVSNINDAGHGRKIFRVGGLYTIWTGQTY